MEERLGGLGECCRGGGESGVDFGKDLVEGARGPAEGVSNLVPFGDELVDGALERGQIGEGGRAEALATEDPEPLLDRVHPRAVDWSEVGDEARMVGQPLSDELAMMNG